MDPVRGTTPGTLAAATAVADRLAGTWRVEPNADAIVAAAVEDAVAPMNAFVRLIARRKLLRRFPAPQTVSIERHGRNLEIVFPGDSTAPLPLTGEWIHVGDRAFQLRIEGGSLCRFGTSPEGTRKIVFTPERAPGRLAVETIVTSPRLPAPLHFRLSFTLAAPSAPAG
jgi:hypothetical protein